MSQNGSPTEAERITEITNCNICLETVKDAVLCPQCSKPFCRECIVQSLNSGHTNCPVCRTTVSGIDAFGKCYWMQDLLQLKEHLDRQRQQHQQSTRQQNDEYSKCTVHPNEHNYYYCVDCRKLACPLCMILICGLERHKIKIYDVLRTENEQKIREQIQSLNNKLIDQKAYDQRIDQSIQSLEQGRDQKRNQLQNLFDQILSGFETKVQERINKLEVERNRTKVEIETVENKISEAENMILNQTNETVRNDAQSISNQLVLIQTFEQMINNQPTRVESNPSDLQKMVASIANEQVRAIMPRRLTREDITSIIESPENRELVLNRAERYRNELSNQQTRNNTINNSNNNNTSNLTPRAENVFNPRVTTRQQISAQPSNLTSNHIANSHDSIVRQQRYDPETVRISNQNQVQNEETAQRMYLVQNQNQNRARTSGVAKSNPNFQSNNPLLKHSSSYIDPSSSSTTPRNLRLPSINDLSLNSARMTNRESNLCKTCNICNKTARDAVFCNSCCTPFCRDHLVIFLNENNNNKLCPRCRIPVSGINDFVI